VLVYCYALNVDVADTRQADPGSAGEGEDSNQEYWGQPSRLRRILEVRGGSMPCCYGFYIMPLVGIGFYENSEFSDFSGFS
jgi:hypothetical protein